MADRRIDQLTRSESIDNDDLFVIWKENISQTRSIKMESIMPVGAVIPFYSSIAPDGWLMCDGTDTTGTSNELRLYHPKLYEILGNSNVLPDMRECVLVGAGQSTRAILGQEGHAHDVYTLGQFKDDQIQNITGTFGLDVYGIGKCGTTGTGAFNGINSSPVNVPSITSEPSQTNRNTFDFNASRIVRTGTTTHGKQLGINYIIKC